MLQYPTLPGHGSSHQLPQRWYSPGSPKVSKRKRAYNDEHEYDAESSSSDDGRDYNFRVPPWNSHASPNYFATPTPLKPRPVKRARKETLPRSDAEGVPNGPPKAAGMENGFARMSLLNLPQALVGDNHPTASAPATEMYDARLSSDLVPDAPVTPPLHEVNMKTRSWFEPEKDRIVVLDLDGSDSETEPDVRPSRSSTGSPDPTDQHFTISKAYLSRLAHLQTQAAPLDALGSGALVLYKAPPLLPDQSLGDSEQPRVEYIIEEREPELYATIEEVDDDDDVEMMDLDP